MWWPMLLMSPWWTLTHECSAVSALKGVFLVAKSGESGAVVFHKDKCYGCGSCVSTCASNAIRMVLKREAA